MKYYQFFDKVITIFFQALVFLVPVYFAFLYKDYSVFTLDKTAVFQVLVELIMILTLLKIIVNNFRYEKSRALGMTALPKSKFSWNHPVIARWATPGMKKSVAIVTIFFIIFLLSVLLSTNFHQSFWGSYWRKQGFVAYSHYFFFFLAIVINIDRSKKIEKIISASLLGSFIVSILGILQWLGYDPLPWQERIPVFGRITSTMGQPIFLANYLLFIIPLTIYRAIVQFSIFNFQFSKKLSSRVSVEEGGHRQSPEKNLTLKQKFANNSKLISLVLYITLLTLQIATLMFTYTRGAIVGLVFGALFFAFFYPLVIQKNKKALYKSISIFLLLITLSISTTSLTRGSLSFSDRIYWRMKNAVDLSHGSTALRVKYWQAGLNAASKKPFIGYGPENQQGILVEYYDKTWIPYEKIGLVPDRAHNEYLDIILSGGLLLLLAYLFMLFSVFSLGLKTVSNSDNKEKQLLLILILSSFFSYSVSLFFAFTVVEMCTFFYMYIALVLVLSSNETGFNRCRSTERGGELCEEEKSLDSGNIQKPFNSSFSKRIMCYIFCVPCFLLCLMCYMNINTVRADFHFREARGAYVDGDYLKMYENYIEAFRLNKRERYYKQSFVDDAMNSMFRVNSEDYREMVASYAKEILEDYEGDTFYKIQTRAKIYSLLAKFHNEIYLDLAETEYKKAIDRSEFLPSVQMGLAQVYIEKKEYIKAIEIFEYILSFLPSLDSKLLNSEHRREVEELMMYINSRIEYCNNQSSEE